MMPKKRGEAWWPIVFLIFTVAIFFHKLFYPKLQLIYTPDFGSSDIFHFNYSLKDFLSQTLKNNQFPLWSQNLNGGFPVLAEGQIGTFNFSNLLLFKFLPTPVAFNLTIVIIFLTLALGQYCYLKSIKLSNLPALFGSISFSFSAYFITKITHLNHIQAASFIPFILCFLEKYLEKHHPIYLWLITVLLVQQIFSGYPMMIFISVIIIGIRLLFYCFQERVNGQRLVQLISPWIIVGVLTIGLSAIQLLPQLEYLNLSNLKTGFTYQEIVQYNYHVKNLLTFLNPYFIGNPTKGTYNQETYGVFWETASFLGLATLILAAFSVFLHKKSHNRYYFVLIIISLLLSFGQDSPIYFIFTIFPFNLFRVPSRYLLIAVFAIATLAAIFLENIKYKIKKPLLFQVLTELVILFTFYQLFTFFTSYHQLVKSNLLVEQPESVAIFKEQPDFQKVYEYGGFITWSEYFKKGWHFMSKYLFLRNHLQPNSNLVWEIASENAYFTQWPLRFLLYKEKVLGSSFLQGVSPITQLLNPEFFARISQGLKIAGVSHLILPTELTDKSLSLVARLNSGEDQIFLYHALEPQAKFWFATNFVTAHTVADVERIITSSNFDYRNTVILEKQVKFTSALDNKPNLTVIEDTNQQKSIKVSQNKNDVFLIIIQSFYPGWQAWIDDKPTEVLAANLNQQAIIVPPGDHLVKLSYQSKTFMIGEKISLISLLVLLVLALLAVNKNFQNLWPFAHSANIRDKFSANMLGRKRHEN